MKRFTIPALIAIALTIGLAAFHEFTDPYAVKDVAKYWTLFSLLWASGILAASGCAVLVVLMLRLKPQSWTNQTIRASVFFATFSSILFGSVAHILFSRALALHLFNEPLTVLRIHVSDTFLSVNTIYFLAAMLYLMYRFAEKNRHRQARIPVVIRNGKEKVRLIAKLGAAGAVVLMLSLWFGGTETNRQIQISAVDQKWNTESDSLIRCLVFQNRGVSYRQYLQTMDQVCEKLYRARVRIVVAPLPADLEASEANKALVQEMTKRGNVVFAVSADDRSPEPGFSVDPPLDNTVSMKWGVISARSLPARWWWPYTYYPLSYHESIKGPVVPDVALVAVAEYFGGGKRVIPRIVDNEFSMGTYSAPLSHDRGVPILHRIYPLLPYLFYAKVSDASDSVQFAVGGPDIPIRSNMTDDEWRLLAGKIVIVEAGNPITKTWNFAWTYANIIHNILNHEHSTPLESWTPFLVAAMLLIVACFVVFLKTWLALLSCSVLAIGEAYLFNWLASSHGVGVEFVAPITATILGLFAFSFVLIADERRQMDRLEKKRIIEELNAAHDMQMGLMPTQDPRIPGYEISGICKPADEVGGDFFDYVWLDDRKTRLGIAIGDVSGKAMKAAITAVMTSGMVYREVGTNETPKGILRKINKPMYLKTDKRIFTAMSFAIIDLRKKKMTFSNAGQMQPLLKRGQKIQAIKVGGTHLPLGMTEDAEYSEATVQLRKGDLVVFHTDGVPEAMNEQNEMFGFEQLETIVKESSSELSANQIATNIVDRVAKFTGPTKQHDDMTVVVVKVGGKS
jgi:serine phosphatase RsbU (regulator of sigma subunit)